MSDSFSQLQIIYLKYASKRTEMIKQQQQQRKKPPQHNIHTSHTKQQKCSKKKPPIEKPDYTRPQKCDGYISEKISDKAKTKLLYNKIMIVLCLKFGLIFPFDKVYIIRVLYMCICWAIGCGDCTEWTTRAVVVCVKFWAWR